MTHLSYDNSFEGLLTAIFDVYDRRLTTVKLRRNGDAGELLFTEQLTVITDNEKAARVWNRLFEIFGKKGMQTLWYAWLSEQETVDDMLLETVRYALRQRSNVLQDFGNIHVLQLQQAVKSVGREKHRMEAFVRFRLTKDGLYYAVISPDFNVLPLILPHFENRYADQRWLIYDSRRNYGIHYDLETTAFIELAPNELLRESVLQPDAVAADEPLYEDLWRDYFTHTNIASRRNVQLHRQHLPRRYWHYLTEKQPKR